MYTPCYALPINKEYNGACCCNCIHQRKLTKHPWNDATMFRGSISEQVVDGKGNLIYVCTVLESAMSFDRQHSLCEMHTPKTEDKSW